MVHRGHQLLQCQPLQNFQINSRTKHRQLCGMGFPFNLAVSKFSGKMSHASPSSLGWIVATKILCQMLSLVGGFQSGLVSQGLYSISQRNKRFMTIPSSQFQDIWWRKFGVERPAQNPNFTLTGDLHDELEQRLL